MKLTRFMEREQMPTTPINVFESEAVLIFLKGVTLLILIFYAIFSLIIIRQVDLMKKTLITNLSSLVSWLATLHAIFAIGLIVLAWWIL